MAFPTSPTNNQTAVVNGITYVYNSVNNAWARVTANNITVTGNITADKFYTVNGLYWSGNGASFSSGGGGGTFTASSTAPGTPADGDFWYKTTTDVLYQYLDDGTSAYWVDVQTPTLSSSGTTSGTTTVTESIHPFLLAGM